MSETPRFPRLIATPKSGAEPFHRAGQPLEPHALTLRDFWQWACSDLVGNSLRGLIAEYLVARAVGSGQLVRVEWDAFDVQAPGGLRIEVKTSGYLQSWEQSRPSTIEFDIGAKRSWAAETNTYSKEAERAAHVYVFAVHKHEDKATVDPLNVDQWEFYVVATSALNHARATQKSIRLSSLRSVGAVPVAFEELANAIARAGAAELASTEGGSEGPL